MSEIEGFWKMPQNPFLLLAKIVSSFYLETFIMMFAQIWDSTQNPINITLDAVLAQIRNDDLQSGLIYEPLAMSDVMDGNTMLDAIVVKNVQLNAKMLAMKRVMNNAMNDPKLKVKEGSPQISEPFTKFGTANVAALFELEGGQTITVFFHNPDTTPKQITGEDMLISYKFLLNKKDVTIVVAPERGQDIDVRQVAVRILKLAEKNQSTFERRNANRTAQIQRVTELKTQVESKTKMLNEKLAEIRRLEERLANTQLRAEVEQEERENALQAVNSAYQFANATDEFKINVADSLELDDYSPFLSAKNIETYAKQQGAELAWSVSEDDWLRGEIKAHGELIGLIDMDSDGKAHIMHADKSDVKGITKLGNEFTYFASEELDTQQDVLARLFELVTEKNKPDFVGAVGNEKAPKNEPIVINGNELGEFDTTTEEGKKALREAAFDHLVQLAENGDSVFCPALNADVGFTKSGAKKHKRFAGNPIKSKIVAKIKEIIVAGRQFKSSEESYDRSEKLTYHYLKTAVMIDGEEYGARIVIREDGNGNFHYDLQVAENVALITDSVDVKNGGKPAEVHKAPVFYHRDDELLPVTKQGAFINGTNNTLTLDDASRGYVLNLFVYDKDGNLLDDGKEEPEINEKDLNKYAYTFELGEVVRNSENKHFIVIGRNKQLYTDNTIGEHYVMIDRYGNPNFTLNINEGDSDNKGYQKGKWSDLLNENPEAKSLLLLLSNETVRRMYQEQAKYHSEYKLEFLELDELISLLQSKNENKVFISQEQESASIQFLKDVISGEINVLADDFYPKFEEINHRLFDENPELVEKAVNAYISQVDAYAVATE